MFKKNNYSYRNALFTLITSGLFFMLFWRSLTWDAHSSSAKKAIALIMTILIPIVISYLAGIQKHIKGFIDSIFSRLSFVISDFKKNPKKYITGFSLYFIGFLCSIILVKITRICGISQMSDGRVLSFWMIAFSAFITIYLMRNIAGVKPEALFLVLSLILGSYFVFMYTIASWDEQIHYMNSNNLFRLFTTNDLLSDHLFSDSLGNYDYTPLNASYRARETMLFPFQLNPSTFSYLPEFIGLIVGRGLHISFAHAYMIGRFFNLIWYSIVIYFAIKITPYGKYALMSIGLSGTILFLASSYSYDPWVMSFIALGYAFIFKCYEADDNSLTLKYPILAIIFLYLGCMPKAVYFPLFAALLFIPAKRFTSKHGKAIMIIIASIAVIALILAIILPNFSGGTATASDLRGGSDVNASKQMHFILSQPLEYSKILITFLTKEYLPLERSYGYLTFFAYHGVMKLPFLPAFTIILSSLLEKRDDSKKKKLFTAVNYLMILASVVLIATSMYMSFTPVKHDTINGCQPRYVLPLIFPAVYLIKPRTFKTEINQNKLATLCAGSMAFTYLFTIFSIFFLNQLY